MGTFTGVGNFFGRPLDEVAAELGYSQDNILILQGNEEELRRRYPRIYQNILSCQHQADQRTPIEYAQDLVAAWLMEDHFFFQELASDCYRLSKNGADRRRQILPNTRVSSSSDFVVERDRNRVTLELMNNYTDYWRRTGQLHLRDRKYDDLKDSRSLLLAVAVLTREFVIFDFRREIPAEFIPSHKGYGWKPAYALAIPPELFRPMADRGIEKAILEALG